MSENDRLATESWGLIHDLTSLYIKQLQKDFEACEDESSKKAVKILKKQEYFEDVHEQIHDFLEDKIDAKTLKKNLRRLEFNKSKKFWIGGSIGAVMIAAIAAFLVFGDDEDFESIEVTEEA